MKQKKTSRFNIGDNMLTALSVARDCDMIPDDAKIIVVEATESNTTPTFTYAQVFNRRVKEVRYDPNVRKSHYIFTYFVNRYLINKKNSFHFNYYHYSVFV